MKKLYGAVLSLVLMTSSVLAGNGAATISDFSGKVLINKGKGFVPAVGVTSLGAGDKVLVGENSFAVLSYAECAVSISSPTVISITKTAPCIGGAEDVAIVQPVAGSVGAPPPTIPVPLIVLGVAGAAGVAIIASGVLDDNNDPASGP